jgi:hypothetical protein
MWAVFHNSSISAFSVQLAQNEEFFFSILGMTDLGANFYYIDKYNKISFFIS